MTSAIAANKANYGPAIDALAAKLAVESAALHAVLAVEVGEIPPDGGMPTLRFEVHVCQDRAGGKRAALAEVIQLRPPADAPRYDGRGHFYLRNKVWVPVHASQGDEYAAMIGAARVVGDVALESASWGVAQIMGFNWPLLDYKSVRRYVGSAIAGGVTKQLDHLGRFIQASDGMLDALRTRDWLTFATEYNGTGQPAKYATLLEAAYAEASSMPGNSNNA